MTTQLAHSITDEMVEFLTDEANGQDFYGNGFMRVGVSQMQALLDERKELVRDRERLDWLADPDNTTGNVQLPIKCVTENVHSLRAAIDAAMVKA